MQDCIRKPQKAIYDSQAERLRGRALPERWGPMSMRATSTDEPEQRPTPARRILIVEDNSDGRESLRTLMELLGYRVEVARDGISGLEKALSWRPEVVLLDIGLPGLDGYQVAHRLRSALGQEIVLIAHTGYGRPEDRRRALEAGCNAHLIKPVDISELCRLLGKPPVHAES